MSELLREAKEKRTNANLSTESPSYNWLNDSYYLGEQNAWREAVELIEKHEKPKLTENQEKLYQDYKTEYEEDPTFREALDKDAITALRKFLEEVEE